MILENGFYDTNSGPAIEAGGGAILADRGGVTLQTTTLRNNTVSGSGRGGALFTNGPYRSTASYFLNNRVIAQGNLSESSGGAVASQNNDPNTVRRSTIQTTLFEGNTATRGGAVFATGLGESNYFYNSFIDNAASDVGGAI